MEFQEFQKIARLSRDIVITEKIDGTNGVIGIEDDGVTMHVGSRSRWLTVENGDNFGFALWALTHKDELLTLGPGLHYGEWWGSGIQRGYGLQKGEKRFSLFNVARWADRHTVPPESENVKHVDLETMKWAPECCHVVPILHRCTFGVGVAASHGAFPVLAEAGHVGVMQRHLCGQAQDLVAALAHPHTQLGLLPRDHTRIEAADFEKHGAAKHDVPAALVDLTRGCVPFHVRHAVVNGGLRVTLPPPTAHRGHIATRLDHGTRRRDPIRTNFAVTIDELHPAQAR